MDMVTLQGPGADVLSMDPRRLNDMEAGVHFLARVGLAMPDMRMSDLLMINQQDPLGKPCSGFWDCTKSFGSNVYEGAKEVVGDVVKGTGDVVSSTVGLVGRVGGSTVRLASDPKVVDAAGRAASAYATGGGSEAVNSILGGDSNSNAATLLEQLGAGWKRLFGGGAPQYQAQPQQSGMMAMLPWLVAGGAVLVLVARPAGRR